MVSGRRWMETKSETRSPSEKFNHTTNALKVLTLCGTLWLSQLWVLLLKAINAKDFRSATRRPMFPRSIGWYAPLPLLLAIVGDRRTKWTFVHSPKICRSNTGRSQGHWLKSDKSVHCFLRVISQGDRFVHPHVVSRWSWWHMWITWAKKYAKSRDHSSWK